MEKTRGRERERDEKKSEEPSYSFALCTANGLYGMRCACGILRGTGKTVEFFILSFKSYVTRRTFRANDLIYVNEDIRQKNFNSIRLENWLKFVLKARLAERVFSSFLCQTV